MKTIIHLTIFSLCLALLAACGGAAALPAGEWKLASLNGSPVLAGTQLTIAFQDGLVSGASGCNSFSGEYEQSGAGLKFGLLASTLMACMEEGVMEQEAAYLAALQAVETVEVGEQTLTLRGPGIELVYQK